MMYFFKIAFKCFNVLVIEKKIIHTHTHTHLYTYTHIYIYKAIFIQSDLHLRTKPNKSS